MNSRERLMTALDLGIPDRVPTWDWFDEAVTIGVAEVLGLNGYDSVTSLRPCMCGTWQAPHAPPAVPAAPVRSERSSPSR